MCLALTYVYVHVYPNRINKGEFPTCSGVSFIEVQFQLMLSYCINIIYYLYLKVNKLMQCMIYSWRQSLMPLILTPPRLKASR